MTRGRGVLSRSAAAAAGHAVYSFSASAEGLRNSKADSPGCWKEMGLYLAGAASALRDWRCGNASLREAEASMLHRLKSIKNMVEKESERIGSEEWDLEVPPVRELLKVTVSLSELYEVLIGEGVFGDGKAIMMLLKAFEKLSAYAEACASLDSSRLTTDEEEAIQVYMNYCLTNAAGSLDEAIDYLSGPNSKFKNLQRIKRR